MNETARTSWRDLFADGGDAVVTLREVRRGGELLLLLPESSALAVKSLALYPAQTAKARAAKALFALALRCGVAPGCEEVSLAISARDPFVAFLARAAGLTDGMVPTFAILAGNARTEGRRFVFLVFDATGEPRAVVKAGGTTAARKLVACEIAFLKSVPTGTRGVPSLRGEFSSEHAAAFAMGFVVGKSPSPDDFAPLASLLGAWISDAPEAALRDLPAWRRMVEAGGETLPKQVLALAEKKVRRTLAHGDFAPWNAKVSPGGAWTLVDWERGELAGVPGWDWFHFVVQHSLLVRHETVEMILSRLEKLFSSEEFLAYASRAGITGIGRELALAYVCHAVRVTRQSEGLERMKELERALAAE